MVVKSATNETNLPSLIETFSSPYESEWKDAMSDKIKDLMVRTNFESMRETFIKGAEYFECFKELNATRKEV